MVPLRVLVAGGGIGGLTAALALRQRGVEATVFERAPALHEVGAGLSLWPNATSVLDRLGLLPAIERAAWRFDAVTIRDPAGRTLLRSASAPGLLVHRSTLQSTLAGALPPGTVRLGAEAVGLDHDDRGVRLRFADGTAAEGDVLVGADGLGSRVRAALHGDRPPRYRGYPTWRGLADVAPPTYDAHEGVEVWGRGLRFGYFGLPDRRTYWYACATLPEGAAAAEPDPLAALRERFAGWATPVGALLDATPADAVLVNDTYDRPPRRDWGRGRVTLLGDAAHPTTPNLGQGGCSAIADAGVLARRLATAPEAPPLALRAYERERAGPTARVVWKSRLIGWLGQWGRAVALRDAALRAAPDALFEWSARQDQRPRP